MVSEIYKATVVGTYCIKRHLMGFGQGLCCQPPFHARWTTNTRQQRLWKETSHILQQDINSLSFALNKILETILGFPAQIGSFESHLLRLRDFDIVKRSLAPFERSDVGNGKLHCDL